jgi:hypothetical protein
MRRAIVVAMILAAISAVPVAAQDRLEDRVVVNTLLGPGFVGESAVFNMRASAGVKATDWLAVVGEWGTLSRRDKNDILGGQHLNANVFAAMPTPVVQNLRPYATAGIGSFRASDGIAAVSDRTDVAPNIGAGVVYDVNRWLGVAFDYRRFFHEFGDNIKGRNRYTFGLNVGLR